MEVKAELQKPYTEGQRSLFIMEYNGGHGYKIVETEEALQALGRTDEEVQNLREEEFNNQFFNTSLGYIRRKVNMKDGSKKDFLSDILLQIKAGLELGNTIKRITYRLPDFSHELTEEYMESLQDRKVVTPQFIAECLQQTVRDFYGNEE